MVYKNPVTRKITKFDIMNHEMVSVYITYPYIIQPQQRILITSVAQTPPVGHVLASLNEDDIPFPDAYEHALMKVVSNREEWEKKVRDIEDVKTLLKLQGAPVDLKDDDRALVEAAFK